MPSGLVRRQKQKLLQNALGGRVVSLAVAKPRVSARFAVQQHARRVVPGLEPTAVAGEVQRAPGQIHVFQADAAVADDAGRQSGLAFLPALGEALPEAPGQGPVHGLHRHASRHLQPRPVQPGATPLLRHRQPVVHRVEDPAGPGPPPMDQGDDQGETGVPMGEVVGPVHRIDQPYGRIARQGRQHPRIVFRGFLADGDTAGQQIGESSLEGPFRLHIRRGHQVARGLLRHLVGPQGAKPGQDFDRRHVTQVGADGIDV